MSETRQDKVLVPCPHCGDPQTLPRTAFSTVCKKCQKHFLVREARNPVAKTSGPALIVKRINCFDCGTELQVAASAESTMCKRCSSHIDLRDYRIANAVSKNFKTKGTFVVESKGYVFNTEAVVWDAVLKGKFLGKLSAEHSLTIYSTAEIKGSLTAGCLVIPAENHFRWKEQLKVGSAEIAGELAANLAARHTVFLKSTALLFGNIEAMDLVVEAGAVVVGEMRIGSRTG
jgi:cytoskeletal protein CcmA (bactofilin family)